MKTVGVYEAKTHLTQLLVEVEEGQTIVITRHGRPIAEVRPVAAGRMSRREAVEGLLKFGEEHSLGGLTIRELIEEGRRY